MEEQKTWGSNKMTFSGEKQEGENILEKPKKEEEILIEKDIIEYVVPNSVIELEHSIIQDLDELKIKKTPTNSLYVETKGINTIAFVLFATNVSDVRRIGLLNEFKDSINKSLVTAFHSSVDDSIEESVLKDLVIKKTKELAGFTVLPEEIKSCGRVFVSEGMNQYCYLFGIRVDKILQKDKESINVKDQNSSVSWLTFEELEKIEDWRALTIVTKKLMSQDFVMISDSK